LVALLAMLARVLGCHGLPPDVATELEQREDVHSGFPCAWGRSSERVYVSLQVPLHQSHFWIRMGPYRLCFVAWPAGLFVCLWLYSNFHLCSQVEQIVLGSPVCVRLSHRLVLVGSVVDYSVLGWCLMFMMFC
jgi:hypothetical protein